MKLMIASDIHGDIECAEKMAKAFYNSKADKLILLGDLLYHGPRNDLPSGYAPKKVIELLNSMKQYIICVRGNCDTEVDQMVLDFPILADYSHVLADGVEIFVTHGHKYNPSNMTNVLCGTVLLHGHTHVPAAEAFGVNNLYINPGSVSLPKENSPKSYIIYEDKKFSFRRLDDDSEYKSFEIE